MVTMNDIKASRGITRCSLTKLIGKPIKDVHGYISTHYANDPVFKLSAIVFEDDTELEVEGEHDFPYLVGEQPNYDEETLERLYWEQ